jgi:hypothetical protein
MRFAARAIGRCTPIAELVAAAPYRVFAEKRVPGGGMYCNGAHVAEIYQIGMVLRRAYTDRGGVSAHRQRFAIPESALCGMVNYG